MKSELQQYKKKIIKNLSDQGFGQEMIAETLEISQGRVSQILKETKESNGETPLPKYEGRKCRLAENEIDKLKGILSSGAEGCGFEGEYWTGKRIAYMVEKEFGVEYHANHIPKLMKKIGYSWQQPKRVDDRQDLQKLREWRDKKINEIKKKAGEEDRIIYYIDECGAKLLPATSRTYSKKGDTPIIKDKGKYSQFSIAGGISERGRLFYQIKEGSFKAKDIVGFMTALLKGARKKILIIWDGAKCHIGKEIRDFLNTCPGKKVWLVKLPPYCPELNASEQIWNQLKNVELKNVLSKNKKELKQKLIEKLEKIKKNKQLIRNFFKNKDVSFY